METSQTLSQRKEKVLAKIANAENRRIKAVGRIEMLRQKNNEVVAPELTQEELIKKRDDEIRNIPRIKFFLEDYTAKLKSEYPVERREAKMELADMNASPMEYNLRMHHAFEEELKKNPESKFYQDRLRRAQKIIDQIDAINKKYEALISPAEVEEATPPAPQIDSQVSGEREEEIVPPAANDPRINVSEPAGEPLEVIIPSPHEEREIEAVLTELPQEDKEKIKIGLGTIGYVFEAKKNAMFAGIFNTIASKNDATGTTSRFSRALRDIFIKGEKRALDTAKNITEAKKGGKIRSLGVLSGNIIRPARILTDMVGWTAASPVRSVMMWGMLGTRLAEAGKEARLANEKVISKTRIGREDMQFQEGVYLSQEDLDAIDRAHEEANKIYEQAKKVKAADGFMKASVEDLKNTYISNIHDDVVQRLKNPAAGNKLIQGILKTVIGARMDLMSARIKAQSKISKLSAEELKAKVYKANEVILQDYDRIVTQYGTVDTLALLARMGQTAGKAVVGVMTIESLKLGAEKLFENAAKIFSTADTPLDHPGLSSSLGEHAPSGVGHAVDTQPGTAGTVPETPHAEVAGGVKGIEIKFGPKGGIQGIVDLKHQIVEKYGSVEKSPAELQEFLKGSSTKQAMEFGLFDPHQANESALIHEGSTLKFENGHLVFHDAKSGVDITKYETKMGMFDSDHSGQAHVGESSPNPIEHHEGSKFAPATKGIRFDAEHIKAGIESKMDAAHTATGGEATEALNAKEAALREIMENSGYSSVSKGVAINEYNLSNLFPNNSLAMWGAASKQLRAADILKNATVGINEFNRHTFYGNIFHYIQKIQEVGGLKPKGPSLFHWKSESVANYVERSLKFIAEKRPERLKDLILK